MFTSRWSGPRDPEKFPTAQLFLLAIVRLAEPIALTSIFPYAFPLVKKFNVSDDSNASFYAGFLISAFAIAEATTGMFWGGLSDRIGRKPVLLAGCFGTLLSLMLVGFSSNFWMALAGRAIGGFLNGNIGVIQTMVGELITKPEWECRAYTVLPFVWSIGTIIGPAIGGTFSDPTTSFPGTFAKDGIFGRYPYLLPNLICAGLLVVSIIGGFLFLEETHPDFMPRVMLPEATYYSEESPLLATVDAMKKPAFDLREEAYGTFSEEEVAERKLQKPKFMTKPIMALIVAIGIFTYHSMTFDHLLPIFLEDDRHGFSAMTRFQGLNPFYSPGGLGLTVQQVGVIMSSDGLIALFIQAVVFPYAASKFGIHRLFLLVTLLHPLTYLIMPYLIFLSPSFVYYGIYACLAIRNILSIIAYPVLLILIKEATPSSSVLGKVNGMTASAGAACRTVAPPIAGYLYTMGKRMDCTALAWWGSAFVALCGAVQCFWVERPKERGEKDEVEIVVSHH